MSCVALSSTIAVLNREVGAGDLTDWIQSNRMMYPNLNALRAASLSSNRIMEDESRGRPRTKSSKRAQQLFVALGCPNWVNVGDRERCDVPAVRSGTKRNIIYQINKLTNHCNSRLLWRHITRNCSLIMNADIYNPTTHIIWQNINFEWGILTVNTHASVV